MRAAMMTKGFAPVVMPGQGAPLCSSRWDGHLDSMWGDSKAQYEGNQRNRARARRLYRHLERACVRCDGLVRAERGAFGPSCPPGSLCGLLAGLLT